MAPKSGARYLSLSEGDWREKTRAAMDLLAPCRLCPRACGADRLKGETGVCGGGDMAEVSSYNDHRGEEPPLSGYNGSGTIFFSRCNLKCVFCQNYPISHLGNGRRTAAGEISRMMLDLQKRGCHNVNFVTPTHMMPFIVEAMPLAAAGGLRVPLVYNCGGYEALEALEILDGVVDIYLPDMKYGSDEPAKVFSGAPDYVEHNRRAILEMHRQVGDLVLDDEGIAVSGLIIRHLVLPEGLAGSDSVLEFIAEKVSRSAAISLMSQYFPAHKAFEHPSVSRRPSREEYRAAVRTLEELGLENGWLQDEGLA